MAAEAPKGAAQTAPTSVSSTADHAERLGRPRLDVSNADSWLPPSLNGYRSAAARDPADCEPALWYWQMTGRDWDRSVPDHGSHAYELEKKRHRRFLDEYYQREKLRDA